MDDIDAPLEAVAYCRARVPYESATKYIALAAYKFSEIHAATDGSVPVTTLVFK